MHQGLLPLQAEEVARRYKEIALFEALAAMNDRFAKLQDTLGAPMRHAYLLSGEQGDTFLRPLAFYEKIGILDAVTDWSGDCFAELLATPRRTGPTLSEPDQAQTD